MSASSRSFSESSRSERLRWLREVVVRGLEIAKFIVNDLEEVNGGRWEKMKKEKQKCG
jgi:hypothetical protein